MPDWTSPPHSPVTPRTTRQNVIRAHVYLPTDIFPSILARFPQSGYERMRPQSQCASRQDAPQFVMTWQCSMLPLPWECNDCRNPTFLYRFFKCWIWNSISRSRACCTSIHVKSSMQLRPTCASTTIWILSSGCRGYVFQFLASSPSVCGGSHSA